MFRKTGHIEEKTVIVFVFHDSLYNLNQQAHRHSKSRVLYAIKVNDRFAIFRQGRAIISEVEIFKILEKSFQLN